MHPLVGYTVGIKLPEYLKVSPILRTLVKTAFWMFRLCRDQVCGYIGKAAFSTALECRDLRRRRGHDAVCLKVIKNNKDFLDQSLDEIKLLQRIKHYGKPVRTCCTCT